MSSVLSDPRPRRTARTATERNTVLALKAAISCMTGKNVPDTKVQRAVYECEKALRQITSGEGNE